MGEKKTHFSVTEEDKIPRHKPKRNAQNLYEENYKIIRKKQSRLEQMR